MAKIDTSDWKDFVVGELFPNMVKPPVLHTRQVVETSDGIRYVVRTKFNNGIKCRVHPVDGVEPSPAGVITWGAENASFFYQEESFLSGRDIYYVDTRKYSANICRFLATCLQTIVFKYPYNFGLFPELLKDERIMLPVDSEGEPNWMYMEEYMQKILEEVESSIENLRQTDNRKHEANISEWKEFVIGNLFDIHPTKSYKKINIELFEKNGTNPVVVNTGFNNGIGGYASLECTEKAGTITFTDTAAKSTDSFFYQERDFIGYPHVQGMYAKTHEWTKNEGLFLNSVIKSLLKGQYDFIRKMTRAEMLKLKVKLPAVVNDDGTYRPDWDYMDSYMQRITEMATLTIENLEKISLTE